MPRTRTIAIAIVALLVVLALIFMYVPIGGGGRPIFGWNCVNVGGVTKTVPQDSLVFRLTHWESSYSSQVYVEQAFTKPFGPESWGFWHTKGAERMAASKAVLKSAEQGNYELGNILERDHVWFRCHIDNMTP